jgi:hypothetical protein
LYRSLINAAISKRDEIGGAYTTCGKKRNSYGILLEKPEGRKPVGRPRRRWEDILAS